MQQIDLSSTRTPDLNTTALYGLGREHELAFGFILVNPKGEILAFPEHARDIDIKKICQIVSEKFNDYFTKDSNLPENWRKFFLCKKGFRLYPDEKHIEIATPPGKNKDEIYFNNAAVRFICKELKNFLQTNQDCQNTIIDCLSPVEGYIDLNNAHFEKIDLYRISHCPSSSSERYIETFGHHMNLSGRSLSVFNSPAAFQFLLGLQALFAPGAVYSDRNKSSERFILSPKIEIAESIYSKGDGTGVFDHKPARSAVDSRVTIAFIEDSPFDLTELLAPIVGLIPLILQVEEQEKCKIFSQFFGSKTHFDRTTYKLSEDNLSELRRFNNLYSMLSFDLPDFDESNHDLCFAHKDYFSAKKLWDFRINHDNAGPLIQSVQNALISIKNSPELAKYGIVSDLQEVIDLALKKLTDLQHLAHKDLCIWDWEVPWATKLRCLRIAAYDQDNTTPLEKLSMDMHRVDSELADCFAESGACFPKICREDLHTLPNHPILHEAFIRANNDPHLIVDWSGANRYVNLEW